MVLLFQFHDKRHASVDICSVCVCVCVCVCVVERESVCGPLVVCVVVNIMQAHLQRVCAREFDYPTCIYLILQADGSHGTESCSLWPT